MKGDPGGSVACPACGEVLVVRGPGRLRNGTSSTYKALRGRLGDHAMKAHPELGLRSRSLLLDRAFERVLECGESTPASEDLLPIGRVVVHPWEGGSFRVELRGPDDEPVELERRDLHIDLEDGRAVLRVDGSEAIRRSPAWRQGDSRALRAAVEGTP